MTNPTNTQNEHGYCPNCKVDLDGGSIWQTFFEQYYDEARADEAARMYGATRTSGKWGRKLALYDRDKDRTTHWQCPDCQHVWERK